MKASRKFQACFGALGTMVLAASMTACGSADAPDRGAAQPVAASQIDELTPLVASVLDQPIPFKGSDGLTHVVYELEVLNASSRAATITKVETVGSTGQVLHTLQGQELVERTISIPANRDPSTITTLEAGQTVVLLLDGTYPSRDQVPDEFTHRFTSRLSPVDPESMVSRLYGSITERTGEVTLGDGEPVTLAPPLAGDEWMVANGCCAASPHRRTLLPVDGRITPIERFAIDWFRVDPALDPATLPHPWMLPSLSDPAQSSTNEAYLAYDAPLLAVADGTVVKVVDGRADETPQTEVTGLEMDEIGGNYMLLDIGDGFYAFYAHVEAGSFEVEEGDRVEQGEVIGHLGNSGNSTEPHLHFQIGREPTAFTVTNWPYEFTSFDVTGTLDPQDRAVAESPTPARKTEALPLQWNVVTFPDPAADH
jgi:hypothetical protein